MSEYDDPETGETNFKHFYANNIVKAFFESRTLSYRKTLEYFYRVFIPNYKKKKMKKMIKASNKRSKLENSVR